jgi:hypothetical protein
VPIVVLDLIRTTLAAWVLNSQPVNFRPATWRRTFAANPAVLAVVQALDAQQRLNGHIPRDAVLAAAATGPVQAVAASMVWGYGPDNRGPGRAAAALAGPVAATIGNMAANLNSGNADAVASAFTAMFGRNGKPRLRNCSVAFVTKIMHFMGYNSTVRPRPMIYDARVATALARMPDGPVVGHPDSDKIWSDAYQRYCQWAEDLAVALNSEPCVVEYALFDVGGRL